MLDGKPLMRCCRSSRHWLNRNTRRQARRNIHAHYDLGNAFYSAWLDPTHDLFVGAVRRGPARSRRGPERQISRARAKPSTCSPTSSVLEIGCGWGGFAEFAAKTSAPRSSASPSAQQQHDFAQAADPGGGLADKVEIRLQDYRDERGPLRPHRLDRDVRGGRRAVLADLLPPVARPPAARRAGGLQVITIQDSMFPSYRRELDFIQRYVFPGGMLPSPHILKKLGERFGVPRHPRARLRTGLRQHARQMAQPLPRRLAEPHAARLRRALPPAVGVLPRLLRGRFPLRKHRRAPDGFCKAALNFPDLHFDGSYARVSR